MFKILSGLAPRYLAEMLSYSNSFIDYWLQSSKKTRDLQQIAQIISKIVLHLLDRSCGTNRMTQQFTKWDFPEEIPVSSTSFPMLVVISSSALKLMEWRSPSSSPIFRLFIIIISFLFTKIIISPFIIVLLALGTAVLILHQNISYGSDS